MNTVKFLLLTLLFSAIMTPSGDVYALEQFNISNWFTNLHPTVATFSVSEDGSAVGTTTNDIPFKLSNIPNEIGLRIQKFEIQDHFHFLIAGNVIYTLPEISANLANLYNKN